MGWERDRNYNSKASLGSMKYLWDHCCEWKNYKNWDTRRKNKYMLIRPAAHIEKEEVLEWEKEGEGDYSMREEERKRLLLW